MNARVAWNTQWLVRTMPARSIVTLRWNNVSDAKVEVYVTTGDQTSLLTQQTSIFFHD
jgi:hypothetical protein